MTPLENRQSIVNRREELIAREEAAEEELYISRRDLRVLQEECPHPNTETFCLEGGGWVTDCEDCHKSRFATEEEVVSAEAQAQRA